MRDVIFYLYLFTIRMFLRMGIPFSKKLRLFLLARKDPSKWIEGAAKVNGEKNTQKTTKKRVVWFHAASQGEFEALLPILHRLNGSDAQDFRIIFTVFSLSPLEKVLKIPNLYSKLHFLYVGASPLEGEWGKWFTRYNPNLFISYKYESWPDLWRALKLHGIPLWILAAAPRRSLLWLSRLGRWGLQRLPDIRFFCLTDIGKEILLGWFPLNARAELLADLRWDRQKDLVKDLARTGATDLTTERATKLPAVDVVKTEISRPIIAFGSIYEEDLLHLFNGEVLRDLHRYHLTATFYFFPHRLQAENISLIRHWLEKIPVRCELITEPGILNGFYHKADIAWVGGGFTNGIHSTIQPAFAGIPIFSGPKNVETFQETGPLEATGQLQVLRFSQDIGPFWTYVRQWQENIEEKNRWEKNAEDRTGGADQIVDLLVNHR